MDVWTIFSLAIGPGLAWLWYFYHRDRFEPEPLSLIGKVFFLGMVATVPVYLFETLGSFAVLTSGLVYQVLLVPVIEESCKFFPVYLFAYHNREFDEPMDGIVYATSSALGFASIENLIYLLPITILPVFLFTGFFRAIFSVPGHALFSVMWGYSLGIAKFRPPGKRYMIIAGGLLLGIAFHGVFNLLLRSDFLGFALLILIAVPVIWWIVDQRIAQVLPEKRG